MGGEGNGATATIIGPTVNTGSGSGGTGGGSQAVGGAAGIVLIRYAVA